MHERNMFFWKKMPFVKLLLPLMAGIGVQWYLQFPTILWQCFFAAVFLVYSAFFFLPLFTRQKYASSGGIVIAVLFISIGAILVSVHDVRQNNNWFSQLSGNNSTFILTLAENPVEKAKSFKATASVNYVIKHQEKHATSGKLILYFSKDSFPDRISEGSVIVIKKPLQEIKNSGNPGSFDYKRYCLFQQITHQVYLNPGEFVLLNEKHATWLAQLINIIRKKVLAILTTYIPGDKEKGLAEALLIGYKDDLDKTLVQSYSNTGVVHIIAISGLHLGLIYWLLLQILKPLQQKKYIKWLKPVVIIAGLWLFSLLAGAQPSVLRSAVMFTCLALGESIGRKSSIYNSLAASAFILLCFNPYWLWDVGFQLSYAAVLSIVIFMQPVYNLFYIKNKALDLIWKMNAVTIAAQVLTVPISIYHFHQFPNYFLLTNFIAVPLSSLILLGEILLCIVSFIPFIAFLVGKCLYGMIWLMNTWVERIEVLPFSLWDGLQISFVQTILLTIVICLFCYWLMEKNKTSFITGLVVLLGFISIRTVSFLQSQNQQKIIVYNVPRQTAIDIIDGRNYKFIGDSLLEKDDFARNFHLKPSRILDRIYKNDQKEKKDKGESYFTWSGKHILWIDGAIKFTETDTKPVIDLLILSKNPKLYVSQLANQFSIRQVVIDGSVPVWKKKYWQKDCDSLDIPNYDVSEQGAFVMNFH
ncbi:MAG: ComEC/Rec2 family competence protein [Bacteroidetes bacterium]|nr:ComEC/Rec2 family competence protein [Bacteroidota bacterium]